MQPMPDATGRKLRVACCAALAASLLGACSLRIEVLDIDLAGRYEPWRSASQRVRILTDITWPRFKLRYALNQAGVTLREGEDTLTDLNYLRRTAAFSESDPLRYEKALLADWVRSVTGAR